MLLILRCAVFEITSLTWSLKWWKCLMCRSPQHLLALKRDLNGVANESEHKNTHDERMNVVFSVLQSGTTQQCAHVWGMSICFGLLTDCQHHTCQHADTCNFSSRSLTSAKSTPMENCCSRVKYVASRSLTLEIYKKCKNVRQRMMIRYAKLTAYSIHK